MDIQKSIETVNTLANGVNPTTGELFSPDSPYNHPDIIRALFVCLETMKKPTKARLTSEQRQVENVKNGLPKNCGLLWTEEAKNSLDEQFNNGANFQQLSKNLERTIGSIKIQLQKQGLISSDELRRF